MNHEASFVILSMIHLKCVFCKMPGTILRILIVANVSKNLDGIRWPFSRATDFVEVRIFYGEPVCVGTS